MNKGTHLLVSLATGIVIVTDYHSIISAQSLGNRAPVYATIVPQGGNSISGHVFGNSRQTVPDVYVELLDEVNSTINQVKTNGSGFFAFRNLSQGTFKVRVRPYGTDYAEQTQEVTIQNISIIRGGGNDNAQVDIYLKVRPNANSGPLAAPVGTIFAQAVPDEARKLYEIGIGNLRAKKEKEGFANLKRSLEIFPTYYLALDRLGTEYVTRGYNEAAYILLTKAVEVNPRSFSSVFGLGIAQYHLKQINQAIENLQRASALYNKSINAHLWLGIALERAGKMDQAETAFKQANTLGKGKTAEVHWQMARLYSGQKRYKEAADELDLYLKSQTDKSDTEKVKQLIQQLREKAVKQ